MQDAADPGEDGEDGTPDEHDDEDERPFLEAGDLAVKAPPGRGRGRLAFGPGRPLKQ